MAQSTAHLLFFFIFSLTPSWGRGVVEGGG